MYFLHDYLSKTWPMHPWRKPLCAAKNPRNLAHKLRKLTRYAGAPAAKKRSADRAAAPRNRRIRCRRPCATRHGHTFKNERGRAAGASFINKEKRPTGMNQRANKRKHRAVLRVRVAVRFYPYPHIIGLDH